MVVILSTPCWVNVCPLVSCANAYMHKPCHTNFLSNHESSSSHYRYLVTDEQTKLCNRKFEFFR